MKKKVIIYGAGNSGIIAANYIGFARVECFLDCNKYGQYLGGTEIISWTEYDSRYDSDDCILVVASEKYWKQMIKTVEEHGVNNYFVFREQDIARIEYECLPRYYLYKKMHTKTYDEVLATYDLSKYKSIGIYGQNAYLPYLLLELNERDVFEKCYILSSDGQPSEAFNSLGLPTLNFTDSWEKLDCLIVNIRRSEDCIHDILFNKQHSFSVIDLYSIDKLIPEFRHKELEKYKDIHKGKRVFLIGNGPSLRLEDLEVLRRNEEICFGCNKIYRVYDKTKWRADYICMCDHRTIDACVDDLKDINGTLFLGDTFHSNKVSKYEGMQYVHLIEEEFAPQTPGFSDDITYGVYMGWNIVYDLMIQIAAYMGFSEMYLLGVDHKLNSNPMENGNHFIDNYFNDKEKKAHMFDANAFDMESKALGFKKSEMYSYKHGFRIYNATRGGNLEIFERVEFDSLFM